MKIIFLDIDGVVATADTYWGGKVNKSDEELIDKNCIDNLNIIVKETGAKIVISSSWRYINHINDLQKLFEKCGFIGQIIDRTPIWNEYKNDVGINKVNDLLYFWDHERGNEINMWLQRNKEKIESFIIIDDEVSDIYPIFPDRLIITSMDGGLKEKHIIESINLLEKPYGK